MVMSEDKLSCSTVVVIATCGRRAVVAELLEQLARQTCRPDLVLVSAAGPDDVPAGCPSRVDLAKLHVRTVCGAKGLTAQRNTALRWLRDHTTVFDVPDTFIVFFDDDFVPRHDWIAAAATLFHADEDLVGADGIILGDGAGGTSYGLDAALNMIARGVPVKTRRNPRTEARLVPSLYGCNMAIRASAAQGRYFDENLPLYGWLEDLDFTTRVRQYGRMLRSQTLVGVHRGVNAGRTSGLRYGYSQIANAVHLVKKGTMQRHRAIRDITRQMTANLLMSANPEPHVDRAGRLQGNWLALRDWLSGDLSTTRILEL
jgi:GT2 family glycosyltransferase